MALLKRSSISWKFIYESQWNINPWYTWTKLIYDIRYNNYLDNETNQKSTENHHIKLRRKSSSIDSWFPFHSVTSLLTYVPATRQVKWNPFSNWMLPLHALILFCFGGKRNQCSWTYLFFLLLVCFQMMNSRRLVLVISEKNCAINIWLMTPWAIDLLWMGLVPFKYQSYRFWDCTCDKYIVKS